MQVILDNQFKLLGTDSFKIDCVYHPLDQIVPDEFSKEQEAIKIASPPIERRNSEELYQKRKVNRKLSQDIHLQNSESSQASKSTNYRSSESVTEDGQSLQAPRQKNKALISEHTRKMHERWHLSNVMIPNIDQRDIMDENPMFNNGRIPSPLHQQNPELTQQCYLRIRQMEESFQIQNYLKKDKKTAVSKTMAQKIQEKFKIGQKKFTGTDCFTKRDRSYGIQKLFYLHREKDYKIETLFTAAGIFDRYINIVGYHNFPREQVITLSTISTLMAAKLEQPISPSFSRMISLLSSEEQHIVTKASLKELEFDILMKLGFDFNFPGPIQTMERYLRILNYDLNATVFEFAYELCKFQLNDSKFLEYRPSQIAACACILAINIYEDSVDNQNNVLKKNGANLWVLNTDIWNNSEVYQITNYTIENLKKCLVDLAKFLKAQLTPDRLANFDIASILSAKSNVYARNDTYLDISNIKNINL